MTQPTLDFTAPVSVFAAHRREVEAEDTRLTDAKHRILARLREGPVSNIELNGIAFRYGARLFELKREGYTIEKAHVDKGVWVYTLRAS